MGERSVLSPSRHFCGWAVLCLVALLSSGARLLEWPGWASAVGSTLVLPTADAYAWLAGQDGIGRLAGWPMSLMIGSLASASGYEPEWIAFWLPAGLAALPGFVIAGVCWQRGYPFAGLVGGVFATMSLGYLGRTRLGFADTDLYALFLPTALAALWAWIIDRSAGFRGAAVGGELAPTVPVLLLAGIAGLAQWLYPSGFPILLAISITSVVVGLGVAGFAMSGTLLALLAGFLLASGLGSWGVVGGFGLALVLARRGAVGLQVGVPSIAIATVLMAVFDASFLQQTWSRISAYTGLGGAPALISDWVLPRVDASIQETAAVGWAEYLQRVGTHWAFFLLGVVGFVRTVIRWPSLLTFLPLLILGLLSIELGHRFAMYAAPALGLGLGLGLAVFLEDIRLHRPFHVVAQAALAGAVVAVVGWQVRDLQPEPAVPARWADALKDLRLLELEQPRIWAWWDEGYPAQFYSRLPTLADGGNASRLRTFALGRVYGAREPARAASFLRNASAQRMATIRASNDWRQASYDSVPLAHYTGLDAEEAQRKLTSAQELEPDSAALLPDELVVASWQTLRKAQWADLHGRWRLTDGEQGYGEIAALRPPVNLDEASGMLQTSDGPVPLRSIHILESGHRYHNQWNRSDGAHAIINNDAGEGVLMDDELFSTLAVQFLIADPAVLDRHFELLVDAAPSARIFRVRSVPATPDPGA